MLVNGIERFNMYFLTHSMRGVFGGMDAGGIYHAIVGTLRDHAVRDAHLGADRPAHGDLPGRVRPRARWRGAVTFFVDVMTGIPSIVAGLFAYALFARDPRARHPDGRRRRRWPCRVLMIPVVVRSCEEMLRLVPNELREAALRARRAASGSTVIKVVLRTAVAGIVTGVMLAIARVIGETAPLLITVGVIDSINFNLFDGRMMTLPVYVYRQYSQGLVPCTPGAADCIATINYDRAWAAALTLILIVMLLNLVGRLITRFFAPKNLG